MDAALNALLNNDQDAFQKAIESDDLTLPESEEIESEPQEAVAELAPEDSETNEDAVEEPQDSTEVEAEAQEESQEAQPEKEPDTEDIYISDESGRRKYTIDYTDRKKVKKAFEYAAGFRKMQAERDKIRKEHETLQSTYSKLESLWGEGGTEGTKRLVDHLLGEEGAFEKLIETELEGRTKLANMTPEEKALYDKEQAEKQRKFEWETRMKELTSKEEAYKKQLEEQEEASYKQAAEAAHARFNFNGFFGDEAEEERWNRVLWSDAIDLLDKHTPEGVKPTAANFIKAFEITRSNMAKSFRKTAEKKSDKIVETKKADAAKAAARVAKKGMKPRPSTADDLEKTIDNFDLAAGMRNIFSSTKKLF